MQTRLSRADVPVETTWNLDDLFADDAAWESEVQAVDQPYGEMHRVRISEGAWFTAADAEQLAPRVIAAGFPLSLLAGGAAALPAWAWLLPLGLLWWLYPRRAWGDAPLFPTPRGAFDGLPAELPLADGARVLDAGCGLGHGLRALRRAYAHARLEGVEWSWPLAGLARLSLPGARVRRGDLWDHSWAGFDLVPAPRKHGARLGQGLRRDAVGRLAGESGVRDRRGGRAACAPLPRRPPAVAVPAAGARAAGLAAAGWSPPGGPSQVTRGRADKTGLERPIAPACDAHAVHGLQQSP